MAQQNMLVLIGLIDQPIIRHENVGWDINKVGGSPIWLTTHPELELHATGPPCRLCGGSQSLVTQLYCPLGSSAFHRCLYIFACPSRCNTQTHGWQVLRSMQYDPAYDASCSGSKRKTAGHPSQSQGKEDMDVNSWGEEADDWGEGADNWGDEADNGCDAEADARQAVANESLVCHDDSAATAAEDEVSVSTSDVFSPTFDNMEHLADSFSAQINIGRNCDDSAVSQVMNERIVPSTPSAEWGEGLEEDLLVADSGRLDAMAEILNTKHEQQVAPANNPIPVGHVVFKPYYLEVVEEPLQEEQVSDHVLSLIKDYERTEGHSVSSLLNERTKSGRGKPGPGESYEKSELRHGDRKFHKFLKRLQRCPQQCVRYNRGGDPLLVNDLEGQNIELCPACGAERAFELQLLPALLPWLQADGIERNVELDFGTVLVFTCKNNCWHDKSALDPPHLMEEVIVLQGDPDRHLYR